MWIFFSTKCLFISCKKYELSPFVRSDWKRQRRKKKMGITDRRSPPSHEAHKSTLSVKNGCPEWRENDDCGWSLFSLLPEFIQWEICSEFFVGFY